LLQVGENYPTLPDNEELRRVQHGQPLVLDRREIDRLLGHPPAGQAGRPEDVHTVLVSPLTARGLTLGAVAAWRSAHRGAFDEARCDAAVRDQLARGPRHRQRAPLHPRAPGAVTLQQRLLPRATTDTTAAETTGIYRPRAARWVWAGLVRRHPAALLRIAFVVGDVNRPRAGRRRGHGAAAYRHPDLRRPGAGARGGAVARREPGPAARRRSTRRQRDTVGATCLYAVYDPTDGAAPGQRRYAATLLVLPERVYGAGRRLTWSAARVGGMPFTSTTIDLPPGSVLALYTDGMLGLDDIDAAGGLRRLRSVLAAEYRPAAR